MNKRIKCFIIFSVMLNVLFIGGTIGFIAKHHERHNRESIADILSKSSLTKERQGELEKQITDILAKNDAIRLQIDQMRDNLFNIIGAPNFDEAAYEAQVADITIMRNKQKQDICDLTKHLTKQLNAEERALLAEILRKIPKKY